MSYRTYRSFGYRYRYECPTELTGLCRVILGAITPGMVLYPTEHNLGRFDVWRSLFVVPQQPRAETASQAGTPIRNEPKKGENRTEKGDFPKLSRDSGVYPRLSMSKRSTCSYPTFSHYRSPAISRKKKYLGGCEVSRELAIRCRFRFSVDLKENMNVAVGQNQCPSFCRCFGSLLLLVLCWKKVTLHTLAWPVTNRRFFLRKLR